MGKQEILNQDETTHAVVMSGSPEVDVQIATAKRWPRNIKAVMVEAETQACLDEDTAAAMSYALPRGGKTLDGPSVRLAEIFASSWGNLRLDSHILEADATHVTAEAMCWDLEKNVAIRSQVKRPIVDKYGKRYSLDMITTTGNAAASVAFRNAVFRVIPRAYVDNIRRKALAVSLGNASNIVEMRTKAFEAFHRFGVTDAQILETLGKPSIENVDVDDIAKLRGYFTSIKDEGVDWTTIFKPVESSTERKRKADLTAKIKAAKQEHPAVKDSSDGFVDDIDDGEVGELFR